MEVIAAILNENRQILVANADFLNAVKAASCNDLFGFRPGEAVHCIHAWENPAGCGTSEACNMCGAVLAIVASQQSEARIEKECLLSVQTEAGVECFEFMVRATPMRIEDQHFTVVSLRDISDTKRREALQLVFFHDLINTVGGIYGYAELLANNTEGKAKEMAHDLFNLA
ncbi:MAG: hypothetical protein PHH41_08725, partial [Sulfurimonas sp.]|nr:hypothetical protein [Sulfurimonas sp.]